MAKNFEYKMSEEDHEIMMNKIKDMEQKKKLHDALKSKQEEGGRTFSEYEDSDEDINAADIESEDDSDDSLDLGVELHDPNYRSPFVHGYC